jgi:hypothetical protein
MYKTLHGKLKIGNELQKCKQFLLHKWHPSCYSSYKPGEILNEEMTRLWLRQVEHIRGYLWHIYSVTVNQVDIYTSFWTNMKVGTYPRGLNNPDWKQTFLWTIKKKTHIWNIAKIMKWLNSQNKNNDLNNFEPDHNKSLRSDSRSFKYDLQVHCV